MCGTCSFTQQRLCCPFPLLGTLGGQGTVPLFSRQGWAATTHQHNKITLCGVIRQTWVGFGCTLFCVILDILSHCLLLAFFVGK